MKRALKTASDESNKKLKETISTISEVLQRLRQLVFNRSEWVSATETKNFMLRDTILDVLSARPSRATAPPPEGRGNPQIPDDFVSHLMQRGNAFENAMVAKLREIYSTNIINIGGSHNSWEIEKVEATAEAIRRKVPIIYSGVLWNDQNKTFGIPDLLVRSDYLLTMFETPPPVDSYTDPYYCVVDIKWSTIPLCADGVHILNQGLYPAYKAQLRIYNEALKLLQPFTSNKTYILGKRWTFTSRDVVTKNDKPFSFTRCGTIDYDGGGGRMDVDKTVVGKTDAAVKWMREVRENWPKWLCSLHEVVNLNEGEKIPVLPREELYPNMCNSYDHPHGEEKQRIAEKLKDITCVWNCGPDERDEAHKRGIYQYDDERCTSEFLGVKGNYVGPILNKILNINKASCKDLVLPSLIEDNKEGWHVPQKIEFYVDFETLNDVVVETDFEVSSYTMIFMIGVGYENPSSKRWIYRSFVVEEITNQAEKKMLISFSDYIKKVSDFYEINDPLLFHWSSFERDRWGDAVEKYMEELLYPRWFDFLATFKSVPIVVKGALGFGLKAVANALHKNNLIEKVWPQSGGIRDGTTAMLAAARCYQASKRNGVPVLKMETMQNIISYNKVDCYVVYEIVKYLRTNHLGLSPSVKEDGKGKDKLQIDFSSIVDLTQDEEPQGITIESVPKESVLLLAHTPDISSEVPSGAQALTSLVVPSLPQLQPALTAVQCAEFLSSLEGVIDEFIDKIKHLDSQFTSSVGTALNDLMSGHKLVTSAIRLRYTLEQYGWIASDLDEGTELPVGVKESEPKSSGNGQFRSDLEKTKREELLRDLLSLHTDTRLKACAMERSDAIE